MAKNIDWFKGDVLQLISIIGKPHGVLEKIVGFHAGRLSKGFEVWYLDEVVGIHDFEWGGSTVFPGNWIQDASETETAESYARIEDIRRWNFYKGADFDAKRGDHNFDLWKQQQADLLNERGSHRIVKLRPVIPHDPNMSSSAQYPKANGGSVRQWKLLKSKRFVFGASVPAGAKFLGGDSGDSACAHGSALLNT